MPSRLPSFGIVCEPNFKFEAGPQFSRLRQDYMTRYIFQSRWIECSEFHMCWLDLKLKYMDIQ